MIQLQPGRAVADQPEVADALVVRDALEDEAGARIEAAFLAQVVRGIIEALGDETVAGDHLRRPSLAPL